MNLMMITHRLLTFMSNNNKVGKFLVKEQIERANKKIIKTRVLKYLSFFTYKRT